MRAIMLGMFALLVAASPALAKHDKLRIVHSFCLEQNCPDGLQPWSRPLMDRHGNLYVATTWAIDELSPSKSGKYSRKFKVLYLVCTINGHCTDDSVRFVASPIIDKSGNLYGTAGNGGVYGDGFVYKLVKPTPPQTAWTLKDIHDFCYQDGNGGCTPGNGLGGSKLTYADETSGRPYDGVSALYGTTSGGGSTHRGTAYQLKPEGGKWTSSILYNFCVRANCADGDVPAAGLIVERNGNLIGTTEGGGVHNGGTVFELSRNGDSWTETVLYKFCAQYPCADGANPQAEVVLDGSGNILGVTYAGGTGGGVLFSLAKNHGVWGETVLHAFCQETRCLDGLEPNAAVSIDASGHIFGTTYQGGTGGVGDDDLSGGGTAFEWADGKFSVLRSFCLKGACADGNYPMGLILAPGGNLLGTTHLGGEGDQAPMGNGGGAIFELSP